METRARSPAGADLRMVHPQRGESVRLRRAEPIQTRLVRYTRLVSAWGKKYRGRCFKEGFQANDDLTIARVLTS